MSSWLHDLRHAARTLARRPGLVLAVVLTLGPGLGGTVAVFDLVNLVAWRSSASFETTGKLPCFFLDVFDQPGDVQPVG